MTDPTTTETTETQTSTEAPAQQTWAERLPQFQGDPEKLASSYVSNQQRATKAEQRVKELEAQLNQSKPSKEEPPNPKSEGSPSTDPPKTPSPEDFSWDNVESYFGDDGKMLPERRQQIAKQGIPEHLVDTVEQARGIVRQWAEQASINICGSKEARDAVMAYAGTRPDAAAMQVLLSNPETMETTLTILTEQFRKTNPQPRSEPTKVPEGASPGVSSGMTPLYVGTPEGNKAVSDPRYIPGTKEFDKNYVKEVEQRFLLGRKMAR